MRGVLVTGGGALALIGATLAAQAIAGDVGMNPYETGVLCAVIGCAVGLAWGRWF